MNPINVFQNQQDGVFDIKTEENKANESSFKFFEFVNEKLSIRADKEAAELFQLTLSRFEEIDRNSFKSILINALRDKYMFDYLEQYVDGCNKACPGMKLHPVARERIYEEISNISTKHADLAFKKFQSGDTYLKAITQERLPIFNIQINDFVGHENANPIKVNSPEIKRDFLRARLNSKRESNADNFNRNNTVKAYDQNKLFLKIFASYIQKNSNLNLIDESEFEKIYPEELRKHLDAEIKAKEDDASKNEKALLAMIENQNATTQNVPSNRAKKRNAAQTKNLPRQTPKKGNPAQSSSTAASTKQGSKPIKVVNDINSGQSYLIKMNQKLNSNTQSVCLSGSRVWRWDTPDLEKIRQFKDKISSNTPVQHYVNLSIPELLEQQALHNLGGIERVLSCEPADKYSFIYIPSNSTDGRIGRCFYAEMNYKEKNTLGMIHLGIGKDNVIFHAMFTPLKPTDKLSLKNFISVADKVTDTDEKEETQWKQVSPFTFELSNDALVMKVKRQNVKFTFHPLKSA